MAKFKIEFDRGACLGCGACAAACPENWELQPDGKSKPKKTELDEIGNNQSAADACPGQCIKITKA